MNLSDLQITYSKKLNELNKRIGAKESIEKLVEKTASQIDSLTEEIITTEKAIWLLQQYADKQQKLVTARIEDIVTSGIQTVFQDQTLVFKLHYSETKSGQMKKTPEITMSIMYEHNGDLVSGDLKNSFGGGLAVVVATLLRIVVTIFMGDRVKPILFLDEPLKDLSAPQTNGDSVVNGYRERMADFLKRLTEETGIQIVMVTHEPEYKRSSDVDFHLTGGIGKKPKIKRYVNEEEKDF